MAERGTNLNRHQFDRGWSWFVDIGVFIVIFVLIAWIRISGLIFVEIQSLTGASTADVAWVSAGNAMSWHFLAPFSALLAGKIGTRNVVALGGLIVFFSTSSGFFIRELPGFILMGVCIGIGGALCFTPSIVFLSYYFRRRLGVATGIVSSGSSFSQIIMSPVCGLLLENYGLPGTLLIFGGVSLHLVLSALLFFPVDPIELKRADERYEAELEVKKNGRESGITPEEEEILEIDREDEEAVRNGETTVLKPEKKSFLQPDRSVNSIHTSMTSLREIPKPNVWRRLFANPNMWILMIGYSVGSMTSIALVKYGPPYCMSESKTVAIVDIGFFLALSGVPGILVRLLIGLVCDFDVIKNKVQRYRLFVCGIMLTSASCFIFLLTTEYTGFLMNFLLMGVSSGFFYTLNSVTVFDLLGSENYLVGFGVMNASTGLLFLLDSTLIARLRDVTGSFDASFIVCGCMGVLAGLVMLIFIPIGQRYNRRRATRISTIH